MPEIPDLMTMLKSGVHFGHQLSKRNPKMGPYILMDKNGFHIIDLEQTQVKLREALDFVTQLVAGGGAILFLGTKKQARKTIEETAKACGMPYVIERWLGGTFTNFSSVSQLIRRMETLRQQRESGELGKYTKKERLQFDREIAKLEQSVGGLENLRKVPEAIFICDIRKEKTALDEAIKRTVPVIAMCDTNTNPEKVTYPIPANDDAVRSIELVIRLVGEAVQEGLAKRESGKPVGIPSVNQDKK